MADFIAPQYYIECLKKDVEEKVGRIIDTYSDFNYLYLELRKVISDSPSVSTLKRLWSYVPDSSTRSRRTLGSLARYLGFSDWNQYVESLMRSKRVESGFIDAKTLLSSALQPGDIIELEWNPGRHIEIEALGNNKFSVISSVNSKLKKGMVFTALMFSKGLPFMCTDVADGETVVASYVAGSKNGLTSVRLYPSEKPR